jgi:hypothetical protein
MQLGSHTGTFERGGNDAAPLEGPGTLALAPAGVRVQGSALRTKLAAGVAGLVAFVVMVIAIVVALELIDPSSRGSMKLVAAIGLVTVVGTWAGMNALLLRVLPTRQVDQELPYRFLLPPTVFQDVMCIASTAPACKGLITFRTPQAGALAQAITSARAAA